MLRVERTETAVLDGAANLVADLYRRMPEARNTDILIEVDDATRFTEAFTHLRTGEPCRGRIGLLNVLLGADAHRPLARRRRRVRPSVGRRRRGPSRPTDGRFWATGRTASSDAQFFPAGGRREAPNLVNARYGAEPNVKAYSHVSDRFSPFATQTIPATVHQAPYILDRLLMNETGRRVREQYADTDGFTDRPRIGVAASPRSRPHRCSLADEHPKLTRRRSARSTPSR